MMESGQLDVVGLLFKTPEREQYMYYVEPPYRYERIAFYFTGGKGVDVRKYKDLKGLRIGVQIGSQYFEPFDSDTTLNKHAAVVDNVQRVKMLILGRIDTLIGDETQIDDLLKESEFKDKLEKAPYRVRAGNDYFAISKKSAYAKDRFKFGEKLKQLIDSGKVKEIYDKHDVEWDSPSQQVPQ